MVYKFHLFDVFISLFIAVLMLFLCSCNKKNKDLETTPLSLQQEIYVVSQGWHSGLVVPSSCIPDSLWPTQHDFSEYEHIQIGWGDKDFYQNPGFSLWYGAKAVLWPTKSALQVLGLHQLSNLQYYVNETVSLKISQTDYSSLCEFLQAQFQQNDSARFIPLKEGLYRNSHFFLGEQSYYFPKNSNVWTAKALKSAGTDISPYWYQSQKLLLNKIKKENKLIYPEE